ncbi:MAG: DUF2157 domain-containing protein [Caldilineaceae bacterium]|nr:DUF2157 domain-containing protein [Caldilineaceae bacterium]
MTTEPFQQQATPSRLRRLAQGGYLDRRELEEGLRLVGAVPSGKGWARFLDYSLLVLGALFFVSGLFFFIAYNWEDLPRLARYGVLEGAILLMACMAHWVGLQRLGGKVALTVAALLVGALLAVFGQEYQTGADAYTLFSNWALLILAWVVISQFDILWALLLGLLNLALFLFWNQVLPGDQYPQPETLFALNAGALVLWEIMSRLFSWWRHRWLNQLTAIAAFACILWPTLIVTIGIYDSYSDYSTNHLYAPLLYLLFLIAVFVFYTRWQRDLFMLTMAMLSIIVVLTTAIGRYLIDIDAIGYFITGFLVIVQAGVAVTILRRIAQRWEANP